MNNGVTTSLRQVLSGRHVTILNFIEATDDGIGVDRSSEPIRLAKLQLNRQHQQTNTQLFTGRMPFLSPNQQCQSTERKRITCHELPHSKLIRGSFNLVFDRRLLVTLELVVKLLISRLTTPVPETHAQTKQNGIGVECLCVFLHTTAEMHWGLITIIGIPGAPKSIP